MPFCTPPCHTFSVFNIFPPDVTFTPPVLIFTPLFAPRSRRKARSLPLPCPLFSSSSFLPHIRRFPRAISHSHVIAFFRRFYIYLMVAHAARVAIRQFAMPPFLLRYDTPANMFFLPPVYIFVARRFSPLLPALSARASLRGVFHALCDIWLR